jgi:hypothetical protein
VTSTVGQSPAASGTGAPQGEGLTQTSSQEDCHAALVQTCRQYSRFGTQQLSSSVDVRPHFGKTQLGFSITTKEHVNEHLLASRYQYF